MFALNLSVWRQDPAATELVTSATELDRLARDLAALAARPGDAPGRIVWGLRQVVLERAA